MDRVAPDEARTLVVSVEVVRIRLGRLLELVQVERAGATAFILWELLAIESAARICGLVSIVDAAGTAIELARRWQGGALAADDARVGIVRLALGMLRHLDARR